MRLEEYVKQNCINKFQFFCRCGIDVNHGYRYIQGLYKLNVEEAKKIVDTIEEIKKQKGNVTMKDLV